MAYLDNTGVTRLVTDLKAKLAEKEHEHSAANVTSGTLAVARGGTGLAASPSMLTNLGSTTADDVLKASPRPGVTGTLPIAQGGTGATTAAGAAENIVDGQAIEPASVAATGEVSAKAGTTTHKLTEKAEDTRADNLEASIAYVESTTAKTNHAVGDYFMLGDVLMCATSAIATGEQITTSNATPATVQGQIDALRDSVLTKLDPIRVAGSATYTVGANANGDVTVNFDIPAGYMMVNVSLGSFNDPSPIVRALDFHLGGSYVRVYIRNLGSVAITKTVVMNALCVKVGL